MTGSSAEVRLDEGLAVPAPDGTRLATDVYRPARAGPLPALLLRTPYGRGVAQTLGFAGPAWYAGRGFAVVVQDVRGRGGSAGSFEPFLRDPGDGAASADWVAAQPWCDGRVGTYGYSYCGAIQPATAAAGEGSIAAIAAGFHSADVRGEWAYPGGALALAFLLSWSIELRMGEARADGEVALLERLERAAGEIGALCRVLPLSALTERLDLGRMPWGEWLGSGPHSPSWSRYEALAEPVDTPSLHFGGWYDVFARGTIEAFQRARGPRRLLMGPWLHAPWNWERGAPGRIVDEELIAWFGHHLAGGEAPAGPPVRAFALGSWRWHGFEEWPPPECREAALYLRSGGRANTLDGDGRLSPEAPGGEPPDALVYDPASPEPALGGHSCCDPAAVPAGPADQEAAERSPGVLVYSSAPLREPALIAGPARVEVSARSSAAETDLVATLCHVDSRGRSVNLAEGICLVRDGGERGPHTIELGHVCAELAPGERLRLDLSSSRFPQWRRSLNGAGLDGSLADAAVARNEVLHSEGEPSRLLLLASGPGAAQLGLR